MSRITNKHLMAKMCSSLLAKVRKEKGGGEERLYSWLQWNLRVFGPTILSTIERSELFHWGKLSSQLRARIAHGRDH